MTTISKIADTLRRGVIRGHWLKCPACGGIEIRWLVVPVLACGCGAQWKGASGLALGKADDNAGRMQ